MDYQTKSTSRKDLRKYSLYLRKLFDVPLHGSFPVLTVLDKLSDVFEGSNYMILEDSMLPAKTMARCYPNTNGGMTIEIKESVYTGAYEHGVGAFLGFICHEICHVFLCYIGFTPIMNRSFENGELPAYCSVEWQAKALCGEVMIPFDESHNMTEQEIVDTYHVSKAFAHVRRRQERR